MPVDREDVKAVARAIHEVLRQKGFDSYVAEADVQSMAAYVIQVLDYDRISRKQQKPVKPALEPAKGVQGYPTPGLPHPEPKT